MELYDQPKEPPPQPPPEQPDGKPFLGLYFESCSVYGRLYPNEAGTAYEGCCPRCGKPYKVKIGQGGTEQRLFKAHCR